MLKSCEVFCWVADGWEGAEDEERGENELDDFALPPSWLPTSTLPPSFPTRLSLLEIPSTSSSPPQILPVNKSVFLFPNRSTSCRS